MGVYYHYANLTKRERFAIDSLGGGTKMSALGFTLASRAFHLMLSDFPGTGVAAARGMFGRWHGDSIAIIGDDLLPDWQQFQNEFTDVAANAIMVVIDADGFEKIGEAAEKDNHLFMQLCYLIASRQAVELEWHMAARFGSDFWQRYKQLCDRDRLFVPKDIAFSPDRRTDHERR